VCIIAILTTTGLSSARPAAATPLARTVDKKFKSALPAFKRFFTVRAKGVAAAGRAELKPVVVRIAMMHTKILSAG
ncbi:MAG: hypothetical protein MI799_18335, partial [Desulfobacterales bacterium]|nr:hypothetical protein [Desulfobacterales bacterium]